jgi:hypothetical protein
MTSICLSQGTTFMGSIHVLIHLLDRPEADLDLEDRIAILMRGLKRRSEAQRRGAATTCRTTM